MNITTADLCRAAGISYRQLDYWIRAEYVAPALAVTGPPDDAPAELVAAVPERVRPAEAPGSGTVRYFTDAEADIVKRMGLLASIGLAPDCAARIARSWAEHPAWPVYLGHGVTLRLDDWHPEHPQHADYAAIFPAPVL